MNKDQAEITGKQMFRYYVVYITEKVLENDQTPYSNPNIMRSSWRNIIPYSEQMEKFVIFETRNFIHIFPKSKSLRFLKHLIDGMADYLSAYAQQNPAFPTRRVAKKRIVQMLFDENPYIKYLQQCRDDELQMREEKNQLPETHRPAHKKRQRINVSSGEFASLKNANMQIINSARAKHR